ncbi:long-chain fatty acid--CoA ligase [Ktedonosporobacter rubrisoli]|uniref:Long-chain fatty acid--CoA ligase n=1 Tax=Ktedonosporobacter rubrisoli TaxID=2509675 RepID=A0A4P6JVV4_KTERU|nr:long-chain fatty acid--CoA ligase [Ktedonosporobacter rubrisoli]QBD79809.1 long-chain fatty acid--CoA ligase [Ktedonosporobacter rubrisoli]
MSDSSLTNNTQTENISAQATTGAAELSTERPWLRHYEQGVPAQIEIPDHPLTWLLDNTASRYPGKTACIYYGHKITYAQLSSLANRFAAALQRLGVKQGDRVALALPNIPQFPIAFYGILRAGAIVVQTNPLYTQKELLHQLSDSGARIIIMLDTFYPIVREIRKTLSLDHVIITNPADFLPPLLHVLYPLTQRNNKIPEPALSEKELHEDPLLHRMQTLLETHIDGNIELFNLPAARSDDIAVLQYTGGTTGVSKGVMLTHRNLLANTLQVRAWLPKIREGEETILCVAPFFHAYGLTVGMNSAIIMAAAMLLLPRFKADDVIKAIRRYRPTLFPGIPTMYIALMRKVGKRTQDLNSIKYCISGAAPLPEQVQKEFEAMTGARLVEGYGLSEASPVTHANPLTDECRNGSIGLPFPGVEAMIMNRETGQPVRAGEVGEIMVKGPNIMQGYWNREAETKAIFHNGWMHTGDVGKMDEEGYFYVIERAKDLIIAGGFNIYPREVEEVLFKHPAILEAAAVGVADEYRGETVAAFIVLKPGHEPTEQIKQEIVSFCKQELAAYKVPKILEFRESLPKTLVGKVLRRELKVTKQA